MNDFLIHNHSTQIIDNQIALKEKALNFVEFSIQNNNGNPFFMGRGQGLVGGAFTARYRAETDIKVEYAVVYFDNQAIQGWAPGEDCGFIIYKEDPDFGVDPASHPPCVPVLAGTGVNAFPGGGMNNWYGIERDKVYCINHGRDPKNNVTAPLVKRAYVIIPIGVDYAAGSSLSVRMNPTAISGWNAAEVTAEIYYTQL